MNVLDYIASETERQSGTVREAVGMYAAYDYLVRATQHVTFIGLHEGHIKKLSGLITGRFEYRQTEVTFRQVHYPAVAADVVPNSMKRLVEAINREPVPEWADYLTREFLIIHPFADGNGRVGSLLWNYLNNTLHDPEPMPFFFGEA